MGCSDYHHSLIQGGFAEVGLALVNLGIRCRTWHCHVVFAATGMAVEVQQFVVAKTYISILAASVYEEK